MDAMRLARTRPNPQTQGNRSREKTFQDGWLANLTLSAQKLSSERFIHTGNGDISRCFFCGERLRNWKPDDDTSSLTKCYDDHFCCVHCGRILHHWVPHHDSWEENNHKNTVPAEPISQTSSSLVNQPDPPTEKNHLLGQATPHLNQQGQRQGEELNMLTPAGQQIESQQAATTWQQNVKKSEISTSSCLVIAGILLTVFSMVPGCASAPANNCTGPDYIIQENGYCCGVVSCEENFTVLMCKVHYGNDTCAPCPEGSFLLDNTTSDTATSCVKPDCLKNGTRPSLVKSTTIDPNACPQWCQCDISFNYCGTDPCNCRSGTCPYRTVLQQDCGCKLITPSPTKMLPKEIPVTKGHFTSSKPRIDVSTEGSASPSASPVDTPTPGSVTPFPSDTTKASDSQPNEVAIGGWVGGVIGLVLLVLLVGVIIYNCCCKTEQGVPSAPVGPVKISDITTNSATLTWEPPELDGGTPIKSYIVERRDALVYNWSKVVSTHLTSTPVVGLLKGKEYFFRVMSKNEEGRHSEPIESKGVTPGEQAGIA